MCQNRQDDVLEIIEERAFKKAKKRLGIDLDGMFRYTNVEAVNLMWNLVLEGRKEWLNEAENVEAGGDKTQISAAEGTSSETMDGERR